ncbi:MAG: hypothetical protein FWH53_09635 [Leptospirales bacterium]|nr:hypothetical protein [Leptospirales bacterium]
MKKKYIILVLFVFISQQSLHAREFLNTILHLNFGGMYSFGSGGNIIKWEDRKVDDEIPTNQGTSYYETALCITLDIVPTKPIILGMEDHAIKFGIRGSYKLHSLQQSVNMPDENTGKLMDYSSYMIGPVIHYAPFIEPSDLNRDYTAGGGFTLFALIGKISGDLTAFPNIKAESLSSKITGYKYDIGVGAEIAICSLNVGINLYYSYTNIKMKEEVYAGNGKRGNLKEGCLELYIGIPIESFIEPFIPSF